jgi:hypothetical protein
MSQQQVVASEAIPLAQRSSEKLVFKYVKIGDDHADLIYKFHSDKLVQLTYAFLEQNGDYAAHKPIDEKISERYGKPADA